MNLSKEKKIILKTLTYRVFATLITIGSGWIITSDLTIGLSIGIADVALKLIFYYLHEKMWG